MQDPNAASQELAKRQEKYAIRDPKTAKWKWERRNKRACQTYSQRKKKTEETVIQ
jgi:hypothetical protein